MPLAAKLWLAGQTPTRSPLRWQAASILS
jgi:hypothetical protein